MNTDQVSSDAQIIATVKTAVALHRETKEKMARRIDALLMSLPKGVSIEVAGHRIGWRKVEAECSQWANGAYPVTGRKRAHVIDDTYTVVPVDVSHWDGHNHQDMVGALSLAESGDLVTWAAAGLLREIARALPTALLAYAARKTAEAAVIAEVLS